MRSSFFPRIRAHSGFWAERGRTQFFLSVYSWMLGSTPTPTTFENLQKADLLSRMVEALSCRWLKHGLSRDKVDKMLFIILFVYSEFAVSRETSALVVFFSTTKYIEIYNRKALTAIEGQSCLVYNKVQIMTINA